MKLSEKFIEDLHKIGEDAFIEKNQWVGKLVPDIIIDNLQKRGINQGDLEGVVCLTVEEAKEFLIAFQDLIDLHEDGYIQITDFGFDVFDLVKKRIEQAEKP